MTKKPCKALGIVLGVVVVALMIVFAVLFAAMATLAVLAITDYFLYPEPKANRTFHRRAFFTRVNWTFAAVVFAISLVISFVGINRKNIKAFLRRRGYRRSTNLSLRTETSVPAASAKPKDELEGSFRIRRIPNPRGDTLIGVASVRFKVRGCTQEFFIEQRPNKSGLDLLSIVPVDAGNPTSQLTGKYQTTCSDRTFFNAFMASDEVVSDLLTHYNGRPKTRITLKAEEFLIECEEEDIFADGTGVGHEETLLTILQRRARVYFDRFKEMGLVAGPEKSI